MATRARRTLVQRVQAWVDTNPRRDPLDPLAPHYWELRSLPVDDYIVVLNNVRRVRRGAGEAAKHD